MPSTSTSYSKGPSLIYGTKMGLGSQIKVAGADFVLTDSKKRKKENLKPGTKFTVVNISAVGGPLLCVNDNMAHGLYQVSPHHSRKKLDTHYWMLREEFKELYEFARKTLIDRKPTSAGQGRSQSSATLAKSKRAPSASRSNTVKGRSASADRSRPQSTGAKARK